MDNLDPYINEVLESEFRDDVTHLESGVLKPSLPIIAPSFKNLSTLKTLDLSRTNIQSLPPSISMLSLLQSLTLQECSMLTELPLEIGMLKNLMMFDLEGTEIMYLPEEMGNLEILQCLRVSFCAYADEYKDRNGIENIIPRNMISKFSKLGELSIYVNPDGKWWKVEVLEAVLKNLHFLPRLQTLKLYLPTAKELQYFIRLENRQVPIYLTLQDFSLQIGHSKQLTSYLKTKLLDSFEKLEKCLKYENGKGSTDDIKELIRHSEALFIFRQRTIQKLSIFDISKLKYCLLAQCSEMHTIVDADEFYGDTHDNDGKCAFENLEYLAIHSMKKLQSIWKGPMATNSLSCLQVLALHTCRDLTTIFTEDMLDNLDSLTVVIVEDCPKVKSLVTRGSIDGSIGSFLPKLRKILLLDLPELVSLSSGVYIAPQLDTLLVFNCLKLDYLSHKELSRDVKEIKGETEWWEALKNKDEHSRAFVPLKRDGDLMNQLAEDTNSFKVFHKLQSRVGGASTMSGTAFVSPDSHPMPAQFSLYETKKHLDWEMFVQYLKYQKPPVRLVKCNSRHVIEFLKYLSKFGDVRVHVQSCVLFGHPNPATTCFCPLRETWGTLEAIATRLHDAYDENKLPGMEPFAIEDIQSYLNDVRKSQENALGIPSKMQDSPILTVEEKSDDGRSSENSSKKGDPEAIYIVRKRVLDGTGTIRVQETAKHKNPRYGYDKEMMSRGRSSMVPRKGRVLESMLASMQEASKKLQDPVLEHSVSDQLRMVENPIKFDEVPQLMEEFRFLLQIELKHSLSINPGSTTFSGTLTQGSSSTHELKENRRLRRIAVRASFKGCIQPFVEIYIHERQNVIQSRFLQFNMEKWSSYEVEKLEWGVLESLIEIWIKSVKNSLEYLFASEKESCEKIFGGLTDIEDICYEVIIQDYQIQVFNIIYTLNFSNPPPNKIFMILDLYQTLDHFLNEMCFFAKPREPFHVPVHTRLFAVLSDNIVSSLSIFEMVLLYHESSVVFVGPVDPLPRSVMSYLYQLCDHKNTLKKLSLANLPSIDEDDLSLYSEELKRQSELSRHVIWIIIMVVTNLEGKAKLCEDVSAGHFFAMKNISYIVHKIKGHQALMEVVGDDYLGKLIQKLDHAKVNYQMLELEKIKGMRDYEAE